MVDIGTLLDLSQAGRAKRWTLRGPLFVIWCPSRARQEVGFRERFLTGAARTIVSLSAEPHINHADGGEFATHPVECGFAEQAAAVVPE